MRPGTIEKFLKSKASSSIEETQYCSLLLLSARGRKDLLKSFTYDKVREVLAVRREERWGKAK